MLVEIVITIQPCIIYFFYNQHLTLVF